MTSSYEESNKEKVGKNLMFVGPNAALIALRLGTIKVSAEAYATKIGGTRYIDTPVHMMSRIVQMPATSPKDARTYGSVSHFSPISKLTGMHSAVYSTVS